MRRWAVLVAVLRRLAAVAPILAVVSVPAPNTAAAPGGVEGGIPRAAAAGRTLSAAPDLDPRTLAAELAGLGPRPPGSAAHAAARSRLLEWLRRAGLEEVEALPVAGDRRLANLTGVLPGSSGLEVVLSAHLDTVEGSPGAADNAAGCAVVVATAAESNAVPRRHALRILLFDGEESSLAGSRAWVAGLSAERRRSILALVNLDLVGWNAETNGAVLLHPVDGSGPMRLPPAWLAHAALAAGRAVEAPLAVASTRLSPLAQLLSRSFLPTLASDAEAVLAGGIPALTLSEADLLVADPHRHQPADDAARLLPDRLDLWTLRLGALVRRLDALAGPPRHDDQYLAVAGRVLGRRDLYWLCLGVWIALVLAGLPGVWRQRDAAERSRKGRDYLPGFVSRFLLLAAILTLPVFALLLLAPAALAAVAKRLLRVPWRWAAALACLPWIAVLATALALAVRDRLGPLALGLPAAGLLMAAFVSLVWTMADSGSN